MGTVIDQVELCTDCKERPIKVKKHRLCQRCYQQMRLQNGVKYGLKEDPDYTRNGQIAFYEDLALNKDRELEFIKNYFNHSDWVHQPCTFFLNNKESYRPDFYDAHRNVFIEVVGSRQAYASNKYKYILFKERFPTLRFELRMPCGTLLPRDDKGRVMWATSKL